MWLPRLTVLLAFFCLTLLTPSLAGQKSKGKSEEQQARDAVKKAEDLAATVKLALAKLQGKAEQARNAASKDKKEVQQKQALLNKAKTAKEKEKRQNEVKKAQADYAKTDATADRLEREVKQEQQKYQQRLTDLRTAQDRLNQILTAAKKKPDPTAVAKLPVTGSPVPELAAFDQAMLSFMGERSIPGGTLAVMRKGRLVLLHGYGHGDAAKKTPLPPDAPLRLAGISRAITAAAVRKLIKAGKLRAEDNIVAVLGLTAPAGQTLGARWKAVTIQHLLDHQGGWDSEEGIDPLLESARISKALGKEGPPTAQDIITYMAGQPLSFEPGSKTVTSGFGYLLLGRAIEKASGKEYLDYVQSAVLAPLGIRSIEQGKSLPKNRNVREPAYFDSSKGASVVQPTRKGDVPAPDGTFYLEGMDSAAGLIGSANEVARFMQAYQWDGQPRKGPSANGEIHGSLPGSRTLALWHGDVNLVVLFNQRSDSSGLPYEAIAEVLKKTANGIQSWPK